MFFRPKPPGLLATIVVPIYKAHIDEYEKISIIQCLKTFKKYPITFIAPLNLDISSYNKLFQENTIKLERFDNCYFNDICGYNKLLLSKKFYRRFKNFKYILICQPDAFVFRDELENWCNLDYDYIGAPWIDGFNNEDLHAKLYDVGGNGGFSLRKVSSFLKVLNSFKIINSPKKVFSYYAHLSWGKKVIKFPRIMVKICGARNNSFYLRRTYDSNEDKFFAFSAPIISPKFRVAPAIKAIGFAFECQPERLYQLNGKHLPFGCHAWYRSNNLSFWKPFIEELGYSL